MISAQDLFPIGYVGKTHGIRGELNIQLDTEFNPEDFRFLIFDIDNTFVPFAVEQSRGKGDANRLVQLEDVNSVEEARQFVGKTVYVLMSEVKEHPDYDESDDSGFYLSDLTGFTLADENGKTVGTVTGFNDDTQNYLLEVELPDGRKVYIPYVDSWVVDLDRDRHTISLNLPNGLID